ncbi:MAG: Hsp20 family protein [Candidatus Lokiarchaeota archaeon]|nr:Hsp20 family protein [Candidatus Lokiarchaeota archaeon]
MSENKRIVSPKMCGWPDDEHGTYHIELELPGVEKDTIKLRMHEDSFFISGESEGIRYVGSYALCCPILPDEADAKYKEGLLTIDVPFKTHFESVNVPIE